MPSVRQVTLFTEGVLNSGAVTTLQTSAWPSATLAASRIVVLAGLTDNQNDGIGISGVAGSGATYADWADAIRPAAGHDAVSSHVWAALNASGTAGRPTATFSGLPAVDVHAWIVAVEVVDDDPTTLNDPGIPPVPLTGAGSSFTYGPAGPTALDDVLWLLVSTTPNTQAQTLHAGSLFTQLLSGQSTGAGAASKVSALVASYRQVAAGSASAQVDITGGQTRQFAGVLIPIPGLGGGGGGGGGPRQFPLGPPDTTGYTILNDPNPNAVWKPALTNGVDYVLNCPVQRTREIQIIGGRNVVVPKLLIKLSQKDSEMVKLGGGDVDRIVHIDTFHLDPNGFECDAIQTVQPFTGRHVQLRTGIIEPLQGHTAGVHADLLQAAGGVGEVWVQDVEAQTTYEGFQLQREAKLGPGAAKAITSLARSGTTVTVTCTGHGLAVGKYVSITGTSDSGFHGGQTVTTVADANHYTYELAITSGVGASATGGTSQEMSFAYDVDGWHCLRYHMVGLPNASGAPANALGAFRIGARTAPVSGSHPNEDATRITDDAWNGTADFTDVYIEPPSGVTAGNFVNPGAAGGVWSVVQALVNTAPTPDEITYPNWAKVTGKIFVGAPSTPFVTIQNGIPVATSAGGTAPVNTSPPVIAPADPTTADTLIISSVGVWSGVDASTNYTVQWRRRLGASGSFANVGSAVTGLSRAQALAQTFPNPALGYEYLARITADNGTASSAADSLPTNIVAQSLGVTITPTVDDANGRVQIVVASDVDGLLTVTRKHPSGRIVTVRGMQLVSLSGGVFIGWDYEAPIGRTVEYTATIWADPDTKLATSSGASVTWVTSDIWLKDPQAPTRNMRVRLGVDALQTMSYQTPAGVFPVLGRPAPITIGQIRQAATGTLIIQTRTISEAEALHTILASGRALCLQTPPELELGTMYFQPLSTDETQLTQIRTDGLRGWPITYAETDAPLGDPGAFTTYQTLLDTYATYQDVLDAAPDYLTLIELLSGKAAREELAWRGA